MEKNWESRERRIAVSKPRERPIPNATPQCIFTKVQNRQFSHKDIGVCHTNRWNVKASKIFLVVSVLMSQYTLTQK